MKRWILAVAIFMFLLPVAAGCSGADGDPVAPSSAGSQALTGTSHNVAGNETGRQLWGYFDVILDTDRGTLVISPDRTVAGIINAVTFFNNNPSKLKIANLDITLGSTSVDVDVDVLLQHPFSGVPKFNGYDLHMALITGGSDTLTYGVGALRYAVAGTDTVMMDDPVNGDGGGPDGYTRWFNPEEFLSPGLLGYMPGAISTTGYIGTATINPYKLFADGIGDSESAYDFIAGEGGTGNNVFASGNNFITRNMFIRFPKGVTPLIRFNYALIASWDGTLYPEPVNATEVMAADVTITPDLYYVSPAVKGGDLILDISLAGYGFQPSSIIVESTVFTGAYTLDSTEMTPIGIGSATTSTYHAEIPSDASLTSSDDNEFWVIAQYNGTDKTVFGYHNKYGTTNLAGDDPLAAFFRYALPVADTLLVDPQIQVMSSGDLPSPQPTSDTKDLSVVGSNALGYAGVYYHYSDGTPNEYHINYYPLDYSAPGQSYLDLYANFNVPGWTPGQQDLFFSPSTMDRIELNDVGTVMYNTKKSGGFPAPYEYILLASPWWVNAPGSDTINIAHWGTSPPPNYIYYQSSAVDCEAEFGNTGGIWGYWNEEIPNDPLTEAQNARTRYNAVAIDDFYNYFPVDHVGNVDGQCSDNETYRMSTDSDPQGLMTPYNIIQYYLEGSPDDKGIEIFANQQFNSNPQHIATIDTALVGTPVDISVLRSYGEYQTASGNWLAVLEDNGVLTWQVALFDQNGNLVSRMDTSMPGIPLNMDCDNTNLLIHVWYQELTSLKYAVIEYSE